MKRNVILKTTLLSVLIVLSIQSCKSSPLIPVDMMAEVDDKVETKIDVNSIYFDSRDIQCKSPFGAIEQGQTVTVNLYCKRDDLISVNLVVSTQDMVGNSIQEKYKEITNYEMSKIELSEEATNELDTWQAIFTINEIGVYGYHFELYKSDDDVIVYADNQDMVDVPWVKIKGTGGIGKISRYGKYKLPYTLTVYTNEYNMPDWTDNMVIYYIFPERFRNGNTSNDPVVGETLFYDDRDIELHDNWCDPKPWVPGSSDDYSDDDGDWCNDFYGGDLAGIIEKLDYISDLGVTVIYMNPIFIAPSNHKYDTADYHTIDPHFGTLDDFQTLVSEAESRGIHIILDCSLNHCGSDSVYMDRFAKYDNYGAFEDEEIREDSEYYDWFEFLPDATTPGSMYQQWANDTLANLQESEAYKDFAYRDDDSITKYWMEQGAGGWRMDVTPWVSDEFWREWHDELKASYPDSFTFCEVWFDASKYLYGDKFDSVMNYIFRQALMDYASGKNGEDAVSALEMILENYPRPVTYRTMNLTSTHDLPRTLAEMGWDEYDDDDYETAKKRMLMTVAFQFTYPGAPTIYYGDEIGMTGGDDPFNRGPYPWPEYGCDYGDEAVFDIYISLSETRQKYQSIFVDGEIAFTHADSHVVVYERWDAANTDSKAVMIYNNSTDNQTFSPLASQSGAYLSLVTGETITFDSELPFEVAALSYDILLKQ